MKNEPIFIIGAGRSGTNILRDSLCRLPGLETWPCDEINYIWRHGNISEETDRFTDQQVRTQVQNFIKKEFERLERKSNAEYIVEKTCANSLKVPFINKIFPNARYIFILRNGFDVASSAKKRWRASLEIKYIFKKAKFVPPLDIPYYAFRYSVNRIKKIFSKDSRLAFWGPVYPGMREDLKEGSLIEVCGKQWKECVMTSYNDLTSLKASQLYCLKYEDFVRNPILEFKKITSFLGFSFSEDELELAVGNVSPKSIGNYHKNLDEDDIRRLNPIVKPIMESIYKEI